MSLYLHDSVVEWVLWRNPPLQPKSAFSCFPLVHRAGLEGQLRVDSGRSAAARRRLSRFLSPSTTCSVCCGVIHPRVFGAVRRPASSSPAIRPSSPVRQPGLIGFTRSSTTATASLPASRVSASRSGPGGTDYSDKLTGIAEAVRRLPAEESGSAAATRARPAGNGSSAKTRRSYGRDPGPATARSPSPTFALRPCRSFASRAAGAGATTWRGSSSSMATPSSPICL